MHAQHRLKSSRVNIFLIDFLFLLRRKENGCSISEHCREFIGKKVRFVQLTEVKHELPLLLFSLFLSCGSYPTSFRTSQLIIKSMLLV